MEDLFSHVTDGGSKAQLKLILKTDVQGSIEAIRNAILDIKSDKVTANFLTGAAGPISEGDVQMASSSDAIVIGFNTKVEAKAARLCQVGRRSGEALLGRLRADRPGGKRCLVCSSRTTARR